MAPVVAGTWAPPRQQRQIAVTGGAAQQRLQLRRRVCGHARGREFQRQRHAVEQPHQRRHCGQRIGIGLEIGPRRPRAVDEQGHRRVVAQRRQVGIGSGQRQAAERKLLLAGQPEAPARAHQLLEVVQHQQHRRVGQTRPQRRQRVGPAGMRGTCQCIERVVLVAAIGQRHEDDAGEGAAIGRFGVGPSRRCSAQRVRRLQAQPRLAAAARPDDADQALALHQAGQARNLVGDAEDACPGGRQRVVGDRGQARGFGRARLDAFELRLQARARVEHPFVVEARHQLAATGGVRGLVRTALHQIGEADGVAFDAAGPQPQRAAIGVDHGFAVGLEKALERGQRPAQAVAPHVQRHPGPQQFDQLLARVRALWLQGQQGRQRRCLLGRQALHAAFVVPQFNRAQQPQTPADG